MAWPSWGNRSTSWCLVATGAGVAIATILVERAYHYYHYRRFYGLPAPAGESFALGHMRALLARRDFHNLALEWCDQLGSLFRIRVMAENILVVVEPHLVATVLGRGEGAIVTRSADYQLFDKLLGGTKRGSIFGTVDEAHWKLVRKMVAPAFSPANVRQYHTASVAETLQVVSDAFAAEQAAAGSVAPERLLLRMTLHTTFEGLLDVPLASVGVAGAAADRLLGSIMYLLEEFNKRVRNPFRHPWNLLTGEHRKLERLRGEVLELYRAVGRELLARPPPPPSDTSLAACLHRLGTPRGTGGGPPPLDLEQLSHEIGVFVVAGLDTTATTVGWALYCAARHGATQDWVYEELVEAGVAQRVQQAAAHAASKGQQQEGEEGGEGSKQQQGQQQQKAPAPALADFGPDELARLPRLNALLNEVMRMYSAAAVSASRVVKEPTVVGGVLVPPSVQVWCLQHLLHRSKWLWEDGNTFRPQRWLDDKNLAFVAAQPGGPGGVERSDPSIGALDPSDPQACARRFQPFGVGIKNCVGQAFGLALVRATCATLLSRFRFELHPSMATTEEELNANTIVALTTKVKDLRLICTPRA